jgi:formylglycine-generating enzyme required for sulfatase activity
MTQPQALMEAVSANLNWFLQPIGANLTKPQKKFLRDGLIGLLRAGMDGDYAYTVAGDWADRPVNRVSWPSAARFCNWLANGQPAGAQDLTTTEDGSYLLAGITQGYGASVVRKPGARYVIPTEDEWYKAAYHKNDGATANYWDYPTQSDVPPIAEAPPGTAEPPGSACYYSNDLDAYVLGAPYYRTEVGAYILSLGPYGTFDQAGNVLEYCETVVAVDPVRRAVRGGNYGGAGYLHANSSGRPSFAFYAIGFRVAEVPEPAGLFLLAAGGWAFCAVAGDRTLLPTSPLPAGCGRGIV